MKKRMLSLAIALTIIYAMLPMNTLQVSAVSNTAESSKVSGPLSDDFLKKLRIDLKIPADLEVETVVGKVSYWDAGGRYEVYVAFYHKGELIASASVDPDTGEMLRNIYICSLDYPTGNDSILSDGNAIKDKYGVSSQEQFVSCLGTDIQLYPKGIYGIVSMVAVDLNDDNVDELVVLRVAEKDNQDEAEIIAEVYLGTDGYVLSDLQSVYSISFCAAANFYLFYSDILGEYCLMIDSYSSGSYTGVSSSEAKIFTITEKSIESYAYWESVPTVGIYADFEAELKAVNAPYAKYCTEYENLDNGLFYQNLCEIEHEIYGDTSSYIDRNHKLTIKSQSGIQSNTVEDNGLVIYSDYTNLSIRKGSTITLSAGILADGELKEDVSGITFQIEDTSILSVSTTDVKDNCRYVKLKGLIEGTTSVVFNDSNTGLTAKVLVTVFDDNYLSYTLSSVPTQNIEKYPTNFYNVNGVYIDSYKYTVNDDMSATVSFDVYNTNYSYGVVEILDESGKLKDAVLIDKMTSSDTGIKEALLDNLGYLVRDIFQGDLLSYRQESGFSKMTPVTVKVPKNGYIKICTDPENSSIVSLVNYADLLLSLLDFTGEITGFSAKSKDYAGKLTAKVVNEKIFTELVTDGDKMAQKLWQNVGKEALITSEAMGNFIDTAIKNLSEFGLLDVVCSTASDCGWSIGEKVFTDLAGPFGAALKIMFTIGKAENIIIQYNDVTHSAGFGSIYIQNQGGGLRSCQQIKVVSEEEFSAETALNVFSVTLDSVILDVIKELDPEVYEAITNGLTYTYNISLLQNGAETQPDGKVTVYIPIPEEYLALAYIGELAGGSYEKVKIYRVEDDGSLTEMDVEVEDGCFVFTTDHFSLYTIVGYDGWEDAPADQGELGLSPMMLVGIAAVGVAIIGILVAIKRKKK